MVKRTWGQILLPGTVDVLYGYFIGYEEHETFALPPLWIWYCKLFTPRKSPWNVWRVQQIKDCHPICDWWHQRKVKCLLQHLLSDNFLRSIKSCHLLIVYVYPSSVVLMLGIFYRVRTDSGNLGKFLNKKKKKFSRPGKSWNLDVGPRKSWKSKISYVFC